ncbi:MAG: acyl-CoA/acyl-ACP dehydrogenase, partial [Gammaproteobacteria bacterium]|nr:acyl-CoA/acyl-ACP dehydrogenase [Gammaproteobacteria bacterium]
AVNTFKYLRGDEKAKNTLTKISANEFIIAGTGANDWLDSNGTSEKIEGGYRVNAHKRFVSGGPGANVFVTSIPFTGDNGNEVLHFSVPFNAEGISAKDNWRTLGMRGTGSNDVEMKDVFVPDEAIIARRPAGEWHAMWDTILPIAMPIIVSCYVGIAEAAVVCATQSAKGKAFLAPMLGELQNDLVTAQLALDDMVRRCDSYQFTPSMKNTDTILTRKSIAARAVKMVVEKAADVVGGPGFFQGHPMERIVRDIRAVHFHPLPEKRQQLFSGRIALDLNPLAD